MSLIIKGVEMPSCCEACNYKRFVGNRVLMGDKPKTLYECPFSDGLFALESGRRSSCLLDSLPDKHGDLIDKDQFQSLLLDLWMTGNNYTIPDVLKELAGAPTIIESEG